MTSSAPSTPRSVPLTVAVAWATGAGGAAVMSIMFGALLLRYMTDVLGIGAGIAATLIGASKIYDAVLDPFVGVVSDRHESPIGRRRPFLIAGAVLCPLSMLALFIAPPLGGAALLAYVLVGLLLFATGYAVWQIPYMSMAAEMTDDYKERSRLFAMRLAGGTVGQFAAATVGPAILVAYGGGRTAYGHMAVALCLLVLAPCVVCVVGTRRAQFRLRSDGAKVAIGAQFALVLRNRPMTLLLLIEALSFTALSMSASVIPYFIKYVLHRPDTLIGGMIIASSFGLLGAAPVWLWIGRRAEKKYVAMAGTALQGLAGVALLAVGPQTALWILLAIPVIQGIGAAASMTFRQSMFVDTIELDFRQSGLRREGLFLGVFNLVDKLFSALGLVLVGAALSAAGYIAARNNAVSVQPADAVLAARLLYGLVPAAAGLLGVALLGAYRLDERSLKG